MRILLLAQFYPPVVGGEERHIVTLSRSLAQRGHEVSVLSLPHPERADEIEEDGVSIRSVSGTMQRCSQLFSERERPHAAPFPDPELAYKIGKLVAEMEPDVVHGHNWMSRAFLPSKGRSQAGFVVTLHDYSLFCARKDYMYKGAPCFGPSLAKCVGCSANHFGRAVGTVTCVGNWAAGQVERRVVDRYIAVSRAVASGCGLERAGKRYDILPTFIPDDLGALPASGDDRLEHLPERGYLLFVGDKTKGKGIHILIEAYAMLVDPPPLVLIGRSCTDTPHEFPANVLVFESWPHAAVMHAWERCLFGIAPSVWPEACGTIVMEGNAVGKAMIASASGGLTDLIEDGETGILVPPNDAVALARAMHTLIKNPVLREQMASAAQKHVERFMAKSIVPKIESIYREVSLSRSVKRTNEPQIVSLADGGQ